MNFYLLASAAVKQMYTEGPTVAKDEEAAKAARQRAILAALSGDGGKKSDSPKPAPITAPAAELLTDEDVDFSQPQPNGTERLLKLMQKKKLRGDKDVPRVFQTRDVNMPPPSTGKDDIGRDSSRGRVSQHGRDSEDWLSDSSEMSGISLDSEGLPPYSLRTHRKRRSDDDMAPPLSKGAVPKPKRGRGRPPTTGQYVSMAKAQANLNKEKEEALQLQVEEEVAAAARTARETRFSLLAGAMGEDRPEQTINALAKCVETSLTTITMVATKSSNLKGTFQSLLKEAVGDIRATVAEMKNRGATDEVRALEAQNARLQQEVESLRREVEGLRRQMSKPAEQDMRQLLSEVSRSNVETFSNMLNARLAGLESRLLPEPRLRPPLAADRAQSITPAPVKSVEASPDVTPGPPKQKAKGKQAPKKMRQPVAAAAPQEAPAAPEAPKTKKGRKKKRPSMAAQEAAQGGANTGSSRVEAPWATVGPKGKKKKGAATTSTAAPKKKKKTRLRVPATAAVALTVEESAIKAGLTYAEAIEKARRAMNIVEFDIPEVRFRRARTGGRLLMISGEGAEKKADAFAARLRTVLPPGVKVGRPVASAEMRIAGLDDSVTTAEVVEAVALEGECLAGDVRAGPIREGPRGDGSCWVRLPIAAAKKLLSSGRLRVGWVSARVALLAARPTRCFRCQDTGHVAAKCRCPVDRSGTCFRCGKPGHKAAECGAAEPNCALCEAAGRVERGHVLGGSGCPSAAKKPAPGEDKASTKKARQKSRPRGKRAPLVSAPMETDA